MKWLDNKKKVISQRYMNEDKEGLRCRGIHEHGLDKSVRFTAKINCAIESCHIFYILHEIYQLTNDSRHYPVLRA